MRDVFEAHLNCSQDVHDPERCSPRLWPDSDWRATPTTTRSCMIQPRPVGQRFSILGNSTIVARLYHSEATLLPDGRVLVSGSDPETPGVYPQEFRVEVYIPPYLNQGFKQPTFTITETDWALGGQYTIDVTLFQAARYSSMRVSLIAGGSRCAVSRYVRC
jgi:hypothetical protein